MPLAASARPASARTRAAKINGHLRRIAKAPPSFRHDIDDALPVK